MVVDILISDTCMLGGCNISNMNKNVCHVSLPKSDLKSLDFAVTRFLMKLFRTSNRPTEIIAECQHYFGFSLPSKLIEIKRNKSCV